MIKLDGRVVEQNHFPDGTLLIKEKPRRGSMSVRIAGERKQYIFNNCNILWLFENNGELFTLICLVKHLNSWGIDNINLTLPYIPNARQDRVKTEEDVFTLKYFAEVINSLNFASVKVLDPHSSVSEALINRIRVVTPDRYINRAIDVIGDDNLLMFYPDEGAMKRYSSLIKRPYAFGIKKRDWNTGRIEGLDLAGNTELIKNSNVLIVDDICSRGGTFYHSARNLKQSGAKNIYLYVSHCENTILDGDLIDSHLVDKIFTTNSIFTGNHKLIEVINCENLGGINDE